MRPILAAVVVCALVAGCAEKGKESSTAEIQNAIWLHAGEPKLTVFTMVNNRTGAGAHTSLLVEASQSVLFDPAGSFQHQDVPERGDVLYGMSPRWVQLYKSAHARESFHVITQELPVSAAQAERALQLVMANGPVPSAFCASATTELMRQIPGFEGIRTGLYPLKLTEQLETYPGVRTNRYYENDSGDVLDGVRDLAE